MSFQDRGVKTKFLSQSRQIALSSMGGGGGSGGTLIKWDSPLLTAIYNEDGLGPGMTKIDTLLFVYSHKPHSYM